MKKPILSLLAALLSASVFSQALPAATPRVVFPSTTIGNVVTYGPMTADAANAAKFSFGAAANGAVFANTGTSLATAGGASVNLAVAGKVSNLAIGRAVGRFALKTMPFLNTGAALYDLAKELGFTVANAPNNAPGVTVSRLTSSNSCGGFNFGAQPYAGAEPDIITTQYCVPQTAGSDIYTYGWSSRSASWPGLSFPCGNYTCKTGYVENGVGYGKGATSSQSTPSTVQELEDAIAQRPSWSPSSAVGRALVDALNSGESAAVEPVAVSGPATSPGVSSQTNTANDPATNASSNPANNPNTSTTTQTQTNNHTYNGPSVTTTTTTSSTTINNSTGAVTNNTTTTTTPVLPTPSGDIVTCGLPGKPPCKIDEAGTPEYDPKKFELDKATLDPASKAQRDSVSSTTDKVSMFNPFSEFFLLPTLTTCTPIAMPVVAGQQIASMDVCPGAEWLRGLMGFVWAASGFLFVFRTVQDVI